MDSEHISRPVFADQEMCYSRAELHLRQDEWVHLLRRYIFCH